MSQTQLLSFGLKVFYNSTFNEVHKQLEPLWKSFTKRKHEIQFTSKTVAKMIVYDKHTQFLIHRLENSHSLFSKQIALLKKKTTEQTNNQDSKELKSLSSTIERSRSLKDVIHTLKKGHKLRYLHLQEVHVIRRMII